jgi:RNA polymerase-binding transcription factor DksA
LLLPVLSKENIVLQLTNNSRTRSALGPRQLTIFTAQLAEQRSFRVGQIHQYETTSVPFDRPEAPADEEVRHALLAGAKIALAEIEAAQNRVVDGTFGRCVDCGGGVSLERLEVLPSVARCLTCDRGSRR